MGEAQAKIHTLQFQLNETAQALQESEETITENMNLNKTISEEKTRFTILSEEYREKVQEYNTKIAKIEAKRKFNIVIIKKTWRACERISRKTMIIYHIGKNRPREDPQNSILSARN